MLLRSAISVHPPAFQFSSTSSSSRAPPVLRPCTAGAAFTRMDRLSPAGCRVVCSASISQVHNYGTVDYERRPPRKWNELYRRISTMENPALGSGVVLDSWEEEEEGDDGRRLSKWDLCRVVKELRKYRRHKLALQVYNWMASKEDRFIFTSSDMAIQLDLIAKVSGISHAEEHFSNLPEVLKDKRTYGALLNVYGRAKMIEKAEAIIELMKNKGYATDALPFNVMMTLYMNVGEHDKANKMIHEMKEENVKFDIYTYNIWITNCAAMQDTEEMERVVREMISDSSINANWTTYTTLATMYIRLGNFEKAESCLKDAEIRMTGRDRAPFNYLLGLYSSIGKQEDVYRIWNWYKSIFPNVLNLGYQAMLSSLTKLGDFDGAESIFEEWLSITSRLDPRICNILMGSYIREGEVGNAKDVLSRFVAKGGKPRAVTWELLGEGYVQEKQLSEAMLCVKNAASYEGVNKWKPKPASISNFLELCEELNDSSSAKFLTDLLRQRGLHEKEEYKSLINM